MEASNGYDLSTSWPTASPRRWAPRAKIEFSTITYGLVLTFGPDPRAPSIRKRKLTDPWDEIQRARRVELQEDADHLNANYAKPKDYSADDDISRIDVHEMGYQAQ
eukprot:7606763-Pyramimonas_sp.AAC.1